MFDLSPQSQVTIYVLGIYGGEGGSSDNCTVVVIIKDEARAHK